MKYLFINSVAGFGSTGRIVAETCRELMAQGHTCRIAYGRNKANCEDIETYRIGSDWDNRINAGLNRIFDNMGFGTREPTRKLIRWIREYDPDVIWIHNVHGYYLHVGILFDYLRTCGKEIRWTLHDCWTLTGHCAYFDYAGCDRWKTQCHHCPEKRAYPASLLLDNSRRNYERKKKTFTGIPNLTLTVPSHWLEQRVKAGILKEYPVEVVYNKVDPQVFHPIDGDFRKAHGLEGKKLLLGVASVWDARKGLKDLIALSERLDDSYRMVIVGLTPEQIREMPPRILALPRTDNLRQLVEIYTAADLYLNPSYEETFGMTVLEAKYCGTPSVVYQGTACEEVTKQYGGIAVEKGPEGLLRGVTDYFEETRAL